MSRGAADIMVVGVGGQGVLLAAAVIAEAALLHGGLEVKQSETHGMSQRGGSVHAYIRIADRVLAPIISPGEVEYLLAFEEAEGLRWVPALAATGIAIVNTQQIVPPLASQKDYAYPFDALARMKGQGRRLLAVDGTAIGAQAGSAKVAGIVLVGALSAYLTFAEETWREAIASKVGAAWLQPNLAAFEAGLEKGRSA